MKILIVTQLLDYFGGSSLFVLELSAELEKGAHHVFVYSPVLGPVAEEMRKSGIKVTNNILDFEEIQFDIIHAQHNVIAILARSVFPETPMVYMSHGALPELEQPPSIDIGIEHYIAVSNEVENNLTKKYSIPQKRITTIQNLVDTDIFSQKSQANSKPKKLLVLSNHYQDEIKEVIENACEQLGIKVQHVGLPENPLPQNKVAEEINVCDIVVSLGRGVLEGLACGRNVIIYDIHGGDGLITEENFFELRKYNFSGRKSGKKYSVKDLKKEILKYDSKKGERFKDIVKSQHSLQVIVQILTDIYKEVKAAKPKKSLKKFELFNEIEFLERDAAEVYSNRRILTERLDLIRELQKMLRSADNKINLYESSKLWRIRDRIIKFRIEKINKILGRSK